MFCSLSNSNSLSEQEAAYYTITHVSSQDFASGLKNNNPILIPTQIKKKRNLPGNPDPEAEVVALSPCTLMKTNRFICEVCNKGFQRDQNLQLHRRGHNLPWKLKQRNSKDMKKRVYVCPEVSCVHHHPSRALGDLTGIKKHFCRKHGEKKWKCEKCTKVYAVQSDWKAHFKGCGTREYRCDCGTIFSRKDSFVTHRAFCDALAQESARLSSTNSLFPFNTSQQPQHFQNPTSHTSPSATWNPIDTTKLTQQPIKNEAAPFFQNGTIGTITSPCSFHDVHGANLLDGVNSAISPAHLSATALLQKASSLGATTSVGFNHGFNGFAPEYMSGFGSMGMASWQKNANGLTRDFLGLNGECNAVRDQILTYAESVGFAACHGSDEHAMLKPLMEARFRFPNPPATKNWGDC